MPDHVRVFENHGGAGPGNDGGAHVGQPPKSIDQVRHDAAHPHQNRHAEEQSKGKQLQTTFAGGGNAENVIGAHDEIGDKDGEDRLTHAGGDLHAFMTLFFLLQQFETNPDQQQPANKLQAGNLQQQRCKRAGGVAIGKATLETRQQCCFGKYKTAKT